MNQIILDRLEQIKDIIKEKKFLLVKDGAFDFLPIKSFFDDIPHEEFSDFTPNPLYEQVCKGVELFNSSGCEIIVAVGGGSTIDVAKCIKLYSKMDSGINYLKQELFDSGITLIAVPTTAGTGSESTRHAVIYYEGAKQSVSHTSIVPNYAVLEPSVLKTLPIYQKKCTMLDALCQAIESWWSVNSTDESIEYSKKAIEGIKANWKAYIEDNTDEASEAIIKASNYAGRAINITATTAAHAMSYKLTSLYKLPHGHAVAVCMPEVWEYMLKHTEDCIDPRGEEHFRSVISDIAEYADIEWFKYLIKELEMSYPVSSEREKELEALACSVNPVRLKNNPVELNKDVLKAMYERIVK